MDGRQISLRLYHPQVLRAAMAEKGLTIPKLAEATKAHDAAGHGVQPVADRLPGQ